MEEDKAKLFRKRLLESMSKEGITQKALVEKTGITKGAISSYIAGRYLPKQQGIYALASALNVDPGWLAGLSSKAVPFYDKSTGVLTIPFISQKLSAGPGQEFLPDECIEVKSIDVLAPMLHGVTDRSMLVAAEVRGDSMSGVHLYSGDIVIFQRKLIAGDGIYVLTLGDDVLVKRLYFEPKTLNPVVTIISENPKYPSSTVEVNAVRILGKVVGWIHGEPV